MCRDSMPAVTRPVRLALLAALLAMPRAAAGQGSPVGPEFQVNTYTTGYQRGTAVASDPAGNFVVVWGGYGAAEPTEGIYAQRYDSSGAPLGSEFHVNTYTPSYQRRVMVTSDPAGNFVVAWNSQYQDGSGMGVFAQRFSSAGAPAGPEFRVNTYTTSFQWLSALAADASGNFMVLWFGPGTGDTAGAFGQRYAGNGTPLGGEFRINTYTTGVQGGASVAFGPAGDFVVVWSSDQEGSFNGVFGQRFASSGAPVGPEFRVNTTTAGDQFAAGVATTSSGGFVVTWWTYLVGVFGQRFASGAVPVGPEFRVNAVTTSYPFGAEVAADPSGNFVVVWNDTALDGSEFGVFAQRYASSGSPLGPAFRVNTHTTNAQYGGSTAVDAAGHFVVVWTSRHQDGSQYGIFGQRFSPILPVELMRFGVE